MKIRTLFKIQSDVEEKAIPSDITQNTGNQLVSNSGTTSTSLFIHNGTASTTSSTLRIGL